MISPHFPWKARTAVSGERDGAEVGDELRPRDELEPRRGPPDGRPDEDERGGRGAGTGVLHQDQGRERNVQSARPRPRYRWWWSALTNSDLTGGSPAGVDGITADVGTTYVLGPTFRGRTAMPCVTAPGVRPTLPP